MRKWRDGFHPDRWLGSTCVRPIAYNRYEVTFRHRLFDFLLFAEFLTYEEAKHAAQAIVYWETYA